MKITTLLASSLVVSIASVSMALAAETNFPGFPGYPDPGYPDPDYPFPPEPPVPPDFFEISECGRVLTVPGEYTVVNDLIFTDGRVPDIFAFDACITILNEDHHPDSSAVHHIKVDLNGFNIESAADEACKVDIGILIVGDDNRVVNDSFDNFPLSGSESEIEEFTVGILVVGDGNSIDGGRGTNIEFEENDVGVQVIGSDNEVTGTIAEENDIGYVLGETELTKAADFPHHRTERNSFSFNAAVGSIDAGFEVNVTHEHGDASTNDYGSIEDFNVFDHNVVSAGEDGFDLDDSTGIILTDNDVTQTTENGIEIEFGLDGSALPSPQGLITNVLVDNHVFDNLGRGIYLDGAHGTVVVDNFSIENEGFDINDTNGPNSCAQTFSDLGTENLYSGNRAEEDNVDPDCVLEDFEFGPMDEMLAKVELVVKK